MENAKPWHGKPHFFPRKKIMGPTNIYAEHLQTAPAHDSW